MEKVKKVDCVIELKKSYFLQKDCAAACSSLGVQLVNGECLRWSRTVQTNYRNEIPLTALKYILRLG
jgi:hypothetical protein